MEIDSYAMFSRNQYDAHRLTRSLLTDSMERLAKGCKIENDANPKQNQRRLIADLGSADGSSSLATLDFAVRSIRSNYNSINGPLQLNITFEEHPASDEKKLKSTLESNKEWFERNDITWNVLMKSFYEPLFDRDSFYHYLRMPWYACLQILSDCHRLLNHTTGLASTETFRRLVGLEK